MGMALHGSYVGAGMRHEILQEGGLYGKMGEIGPLSEDG